MTTIVITAIAVFLRIVSNPLGNVFQKHLTKKGNHPLLVNFLTYLILSFVCILLATGVEWRKLPSEFWMYSILGGLAGGFGNGFLVKALEHGDLSVLGPINSYKSVVGIIVGIFLLGELPHLWGLLGMALIIYGSYYVLDTTEDKFSWALLKRKEIQFRIWAMVLTAIEAVFIKKVILASSTVISFISWCWFGAVFSFILLQFYRTNIHPAGGERTNIKSGNRETLPTDAIGRRTISSKHIGKAWSFSTTGQYLLLVVCIGIMQFTTNYVFDHMDVGYALSLFQLSTIVSVIMGYKIFQEKNIRQKLIGSAIMIVGSVIIIFSS